MPIIGSLAGASSKSLGGLGASVIVLPSTGYISIASTTLTTNTSSITFSSIPNTYKHLQIRGVARGTYAAYNYPIFISFNNDTGANYQNQGFIANQSGLGLLGYYDNASNYLYAQRIAGDSSPANYFGGVVFSIMDYAETNKNKNILGEAGGALSGGSSNNWCVGPYGGNWRNNSAINTITLTPQYGSFTANTRFSLYGII